tara:strand:- start:52 stop:747 length:696 start_codon:yes stop_codon:yes gene_type:complete
MAFEIFPNKTNREEQWRLIKEHKPWTRKQLRVWEHYFKTGEFSGGKAVQAGWLLFFNPVKQLDVWQAVINDHFDGANVEDAELTNRGILNSINWCHFHPEDHAWIFTLLHGEVYDESREFPITFPGKEVEVNLESLLVPVFGSLWPYFCGLTETCFVEHMFEYLESITKRVPRDAFSCEDSFHPYSPVGKSVKYAQQCANKSLKSATEEERKKILFAQKVNALFEQYRPKD